MKHSPRSARTNPSNVEAQQTDIAWRAGVRPNGEKTAFDTKFFCALRSIAVSTAGTL
jgi:hypothetical protein